MIGLLDIKDVICDKPEFGMWINSQISYNVVKRYSKTHLNMDINKFLDDKILSLEASEEIKQSQEYWMTAEEALRANFNNINLDKLLLALSFRVIDALEQKSPEDNLNNEKNIRIIAEFLVSRLQEISKGTVIEGIMDLNAEKVRYSVEDLKIDLLRFSDGRYINKEETKKLKEKILSGEKTLNDISIEEFILIDLSPEERVQVENELISKEDAYHNILFLGKCSDKLLLFLFQNKMLDTEKITELFEKSIITYAQIAKIANDELRKQLNINERIRGLYISVSDKEKEISPDDIELLNRYAMLYKALNIDNKSNEEILENSTKLIEGFGNEIDADTLKGLYKLGLISLEIAADWGVSLNEMLEENAMKPVDLKRLYEKNIINLDSIKSVLLHTDLPYEEKLDLIYSTFDGESEEQYNIRDELVQLLDMGEQYREESTHSRVNRQKSNEIKSREFITDPHARWKLISLLDKEYSKKFLPADKEVKDGHRIFLLPNNGKVLIERMYEKRKARKVEAYGSATYILDSEEFFKNINNIIIDGTVKRSTLREMSETDTASKIVHNVSWGRSLKEYFGINEENERYSKEEKEEIDKAIERVENSRRERE